jgi:hypothetical protein
VIENVGQHPTASLVLLALMAALVVGPVGVGCSGSGLSTAARDAAVVSDTGGGAGATSDARDGAGGLFIAVDATVVDVDRFKGRLCDAKAACEPGDIPLTSDDECLTRPNICYVNGRCDEFVACRRAGSDGTRKPDLTPTFFPLCKPGDVQLASTVRPYGSVSGRLSSDCPAGRECYSRAGSYGAILCMVAEGGYCNDQPSCHPGDTQVDRNDAIEDWGSAVFYDVFLCGKSVVCRWSADAGLPSSTCVGVWSDGTGDDPDGLGETRPACCGNGQVDPGETCDVGPLNGAWLDSSTRCSTQCQIDGYI